MGSIETWLPGGLIHQRYAKQGGMIRSRIDHSIMSQMELPPFIIKMRASVLTPFKNILVH